MLKADFPNILIKKELYQNLSSPCWGSYLVNFKTVKLDKKESGKKFSLHPLDKDLWGSRNRFKLFFPAVCSNVLRRRPLLWGRAGQGFLSHVGTETQPNFRGRIGDWQPP
jgi:hypothetical protein